MLSLHYLLTASARVAASGGGLPPPRGLGFGHRRRAASLSVLAATCAVDHA